MIRDRSRNRRLLAAGALGGAVLLAGTGCTWEGLNSLPLPGAQGNGEGAYEVTIEMPNVTTITRNSPVRVNDVNVGSITDMRVEDYTAIVTVSLNEDVRLPANAHAKIGQTSLLGSQHLEIFPPPDGEPEGSLSDGDVIPLARAGVYPTTEQTLSALSVVLTNGGLAQFETISRELNTALDGRQFEAKEVISQPETTVSGLDQQRADIIAAMDGLDRLSRQINEQNDTLAKALGQMPEALSLVNAQKQELTTALVSLGDFGNKANQLIDAGGGSNLVANLQDITPVLEGLANSGRNLTRVMQILITFPFPQAGIDNFLRGDYANLYIDADMTNERLAETFLLGTEFGNRMAGLEGYVGLAPNPLASADPYSLDVPQPPAPDQMDQPAGDLAAPDSAGDPAPPAEEAPR
ncbi:MULTISPECIES: MCE family protein [unclassified Dietzia]|uniref:MCE family protein n=1 Tax=unclassified Dietzia TaxID=2617939 RepID=UPI0015FB2BB0|nr:MULTISPECIES: MCE family protein [unclassified Dietzia]MBB1041555.1 MCE family protein [Dietzia sp. Cai40]MBB1044810.1 MCE family protein [Dietzia sp. DQ11-44]